MGFENWCWWRIMIENIEFKVAFIESTSEFSMHTAGRDMFQWLWRPQECCLVQFWVLGMDDFYMVVNLKILKTIFLKKEINCSHFDFRSWDSEHLGNLSNTPRIVREGTRTQVSWCFHIASPSRTFFPMPYIQSMLLLLLSFPFFLLHLQSLQVLLFCSYTFMAPIGGSIG